MRSPHIPLLLLLVTAACEAATPRDGSGGASLQDEAATVEMRQSLAAAPEAPPAPPVAYAGSQTSDIPAERAEIRQGHLRMRVASVDSAVAHAMTIAGELGGHATRRDMRHAEGRMRGGTMELRVPAARFDQAMHRFSELGRVEHSSVSSVDVGDQMVDLRARLQNARRLEERLLELLRTRAGNLQNVLAAERELARVREEIERIEARLNTLRDRVTMSTVMLDVFEPAPVVALIPAGGVIRQSFRDAWQNFVEFFAVLIAALGYAVPIVAIAALVLLGYRRWTARITRRPPPQTGGELPASGILRG